MNERLEAHPPLSKGQRTSKLNLQPRIEPHTLGPIKEALGCLHHTCAVCNRGESRSLPHTTSPVPRGEAEAAHRDAVLVIKDALIRKTLKRHDESRIHSHRRPPSLCWWHMPKPVIQLGLAACMQSSPCGVSRFIM